MTEYTALASDTPIQRAPALIRDQVADYIRQKIVTMQLAPGAVLIEREICEATATSRSTVREALRLLEAEGLISSEVRKGTTVASLSTDEARNLYEIRGQLEGLACRLFAENATTDQLDALIAAVDRIASSVGDSPKMLKEKAHFYEVLLEGSGNPELGRLLEGLRQRITLLRVNSLSLPGRPAQSLREIEAIRDAIVAKKGSLADQLSRNHIQSAARAVLTAPGAHFQNPTLP